MPYGSAFHFEIDIIYYSLDNCFSFVAGAVQFNSSIFRSFSCSYTYVTDHINFQGWSVNAPSDYTMLLFGHVNFNAVSNRLITLKFCNSDERSWLQISASRPQGFFFFFVSAWSIFHYSVRDSKAWYLVKYG